MIAGSRLHLWLIEGVAWMWILWFVQLPVTALPCPSLVPLISPWQVLHFFVFFSFIFLLSIHSQFSTLLFNYKQVMPSFKKKIVSNKCYVCWHTLYFLNNKPCTFLEISLFSATNYCICFLFHACCLFSVWESSVFCLGWLQDIFVTSESVKWNWRGYGISARMEGHCQWQTLLSLC